MILLITTQSDVTNSIVQHLNSDFFEVIVTRNDGTVFKKCKGKKKRRLVTGFFKNFTEWRKNVRTWMIYSPFIH